MRIIGYILEMEIEIVKLPGLSPVLWRLINGQLIHLDSCKPKETFVHFLTPGTLKPYSWPNIYSTFFYLNFTHKQAFHTNGYFTHKRAFHT